MPDADRVAAALERPGLDKLDAPHLFRLEAQRQLALTVLELAFTGKAHGALVVGQLTADEACLCHVDAVTTLVEEHEILFRVQQIRMATQFGMHQRAALGVKTQPVKIGFDINQFAHGRRRLRRRHLPRTGHNGAGRWHCSRRGWRGGHCGRLGLRKEGGLVAVVDLPLVPQQDHGKAKDHPKDGAADVVHEDFFDEGGNNRVNRRGASSGTGSWPPAHQGWQRTRRASVK